MIGVELDGRTYRMVFKHFARKGNPGTSCSIQELISPAEGNTKDIWMAVAVGSTRIHPDDQLNRPVGREISMTRALRHVDRVLRGKLLKAYYGRPRRKAADLPEWATALLKREREKWVVGVA